MTGVTTKGITVKKIAITQAMRVTVPPGTGDAAVLGQRNGPSAMRRTATSGLAGVLAALAFLIAVPAHGQQGTGPGPGDSHVVTIRRATGPIDLDGRVDEAAWSAVAPLPLVTFTPTAGAEPGERSEIRLVYDDNFLYASARFYAADASRIQAPSLTRDVLGADDQFRIMLDTFDDNENALGFVTTPAGVKIDFAVSQDGDDQNYDWNTFWDVATHRTSEGWFAEMRIPLSSLRFTESANGVVMGLTAARYVAARNELSTFPALDPDFANAEFRPSISATVLLDGIRGRKPFYVTPYALSGVSRSAELNDTGTAFGHDEDPTNEVGLDVKYGLTTNLTFDLTLNTDFAQVEVDDEQVNLTRFSLFFPEKRQFFLERSGIFTIGTGGPTDNSLFFHSRRVGLATDGTPLRLYGGTRLVGRVGGWDVGVLNMQAETSDRASNENLGVFRLRRQVLNQESDIGAMATTRIGDDGRRNVAYITDARLRLLPDDYLIVQAAQNFDEAIDSGGTDAAMIRVGWQRPGTLFSRGLAYNLGAKFSGRDYAPSLGFTGRRDFQHYFVNLRYGFFPGENSIFRSIQPSTINSIYLKNRDGSTDSAFNALFINYGLKSGALGWVGFRNHIEKLEQPLPFSEDAVVPAGRHSFNQVEFFYQKSPGSLFGVNFNVAGGQFFDGTQFDIGIAPTWSVSEHLELGAEYQVSRIRFDDRDQDLNADIARLRVKSAINSKLSTNLFVQYNRAADAVVSNVRFRYHVGEGKDLFIVYNGSLNTDRGRFLPELPLNQDQTLLIKWTYTWGS